MRTSTVLNLSLQLVFPGLEFTFNTAQVESLSLILLVSSPSDICSRIRTHSWLAPDFTCEYWASIKVSWYYDK